MARTDNDSWDPATSVGATATMVATQRALAAAGDNPLINDPYAAPLVRAVGIKGFTQLVDGEISLPVGTEFDPDRLAQGIAIRTWFFDHHFLEATRGGIQQVVILASGLDSRAYRLDWPEGTIVYEVDQPAVIDFKTSTLQKLDVHPKAQRRTVGIDLREDWASALQQAGFDPAKPTAWSAEGLVIYLPPQAQDGLFDTITDLSAPTSQLACEFVPDTKAFDTPAWANRQAKARQLGFDLDIGELVYRGIRKNLLEYLGQKHWDVQGYPVEDLYRKEGFTYPDDPLHQAFATLIYLRAILR